MIERLLRAFETLVLAIAKINVNTCCVFYLYQDELPKGVEKLKKI